MKDSVEPELETLRAGLRAGCAIVTRSSALLDNFSPGRSLGECWFLWILWFLQAIPAEFHKNRRRASWFLLTQFGFY